LTIDLPERKTILLCLTADLIIWMILHTLVANVAIRILPAAVLIASSRVLPISFSDGT
jgi:hypothetical protein